MIKMLRSRALTSVLNKENTGGIKTILLISTEGVLFAYTSFSEDVERTKAAITASIWNLYQRQLDQRGAHSAPNLLQ
ncbi:unnamed protein product [Protopolystoma xenopodis]|uniref:Roadblock/LAMTOR2 domain-containing protein n=1 Tax=Protopolystoma xenopodis TaxID=117903 RepID=A0A448WH15_9PLAT|nr:unnamed protein product [Protopolystoma xenopodis]